MKPLVLLYNLSAGTPEGNALYQILLSRGIASREITDNQLDVTVVSLLGMSSNTPANDKGGEEDFDVRPEILNSHLMLMCGFDEALLDQFLADMRAAGVRIPHKAMLTPTNASFTVAQLIEDISREHMMMQMMQQMRSR
jgi:hypothetical protein